MDDFVKVHVLRLGMLKSGGGSEIGVLEDSLLGRHTLKAQYLNFFNIVWKKIGYNGKKNS